MSKLKAFVKYVPKPMQTPSLENSSPNKGWDRDCRTKSPKSGCRQRGPPMPSDPRGGGAALASGPPACSELGSPLRAVGKARTLWMRPFVPGTAIPTTPVSSPQRRATRQPAPPSPFAKLRAEARDRRHQGCQRSATSPRPGWRGRGPRRPALLRRLTGALSEDTARRAPGWPPPAAAGPPLPAPPAKLAQALLGARGAAVRAPAARLCPGFVRAPRAPSLRTPAALPTFWMVCCVTSPLPLGRADAKATDMVAARTQPVIIRVYSPAAPRGPRCPFSAARGRGRGGCRAVGSPARLPPTRARASRVPAP
ncbi:hypothetical protein NN561_010151 [Cricetulus griseus]